MKCPQCNVNLVMADRQGVEIDYCPDCRGVWLDRGELDKIIERSLPASQRQTSYDRPQKYYKNRDDDQYYHKKKKNKSLLGELFDF